MKIDMGDGNILPSILAREIEQGLKAFIETGFEPSTPFFKDLFQRFVKDKGSFIKGPYLSLGLPFMPGTAGRDFFDGFTTQHPPHLHQELSWQRLHSSPNARSTLIATGTGSGKTECFLYPLLDHCLKNQGPGIKAIIIYPMNALAGDQAKRFAHIIDQTPALKNRISAGLLVGESQEVPRLTMSLNSIITDRNAIRENPPDILLTNYKMLDFLLLRPADRMLWRDNRPETLRYLVVDELHTFDGAQGTDLACLIRRLKDRLQLPSKQLVCVGTSATLGSGDERVRLSEYAARIFQSSFDSGAIIGEKRLAVDDFLKDETGEERVDYSFISTPNMAELLDPEKYGTTSDYIAQIYSLFFSTAKPLSPNDQQWRCQLGSKLKRHSIFHFILRMVGHQPRSMEDICSELSSAFLEKDSAHLSKRVLDAFCALIAWARTPDDPTLPLVQSRVQIWLRELRRMVTKLGNAPEKACLTCADDHGGQDEQLLLPLVQCSECHATGWLSTRHAAENKISTDLKNIYNSWFNNNPETMLLFPLTKEEVSAPTPSFSRKGQLHLLCSKCGHLQSGVNECGACTCDHLISVFEPDNLKAERQGGTGPQVMNERICPQCASRHSLMIFGSRAASLASVAIHHSYASSYNDDKKLIAFSDSVQDAAHRGGFFQARTWKNNIRMAIAQTVYAPGAERISLDEFFSFLPQYWTSQELNKRSMTNEQFVSQFIAPNMLWLEGYKELIEKEHLTKENMIFDDVCKRFEWEILAEFGFRSHIGRTLETTGTATIEFDIARVEQAVEKALPVLKEEAGLIDLDKTRLASFTLGLLLHMKEKGAIHHHFLDSFIQNMGKEFLLHRQPHLPDFGSRTPVPTFLTSARQSGKFDRLDSQKRHNWYHNWIARTIGSRILLAENMENAIYRPVLGALVEAGILDAVDVKGGIVWGLRCDALYLSSNPVVLETANRQSRLTASPDMALHLEGCPSLNMSDPGHYSNPAHEPGWLAHIYRTGEISRVIAKEHTGLLNREEREQTENQFINGDKPWHPNLLSATPTLEMGIDIGDLSSVLLCSTPPAQANYLQRIGRAGRRDGNAFNLTIANGRPHDLFFYANPFEMMAGKIEPPGVFLNASAVISRQLIAYFFDNWVAGGVDESAIPARLKPTLDAVEQNRKNAFPFNFIDYVNREKTRLIAGFISLFADEFTDQTITHLQAFLFGTNRDIQTLDMVLIEGLSGLARERRELKRRIDRLKRLHIKLQKQPQDEEKKDQLEKIEGERKGLQVILRSINAKQLLNFLTDEGLIPNYAFPEAGVTLRSVIYHKRQKPEAGESKYESATYEYERPASAALGELAPDNSFYAGGRRVSIERLDLELSEIEDWRLCQSCNYALKRLDDQVEECCPRCGDSMWPDAGRQVQMLRLRHVMANSSDVESRIGDDSDDREPVFYVRQMLPDFSPEDIGNAWQIANDKLPFGFEFIKKATMREINFGRLGRGNQTMRVAGREEIRSGFRLCKSCGMVQNRRDKQKHAFDCKVKNPEDEKNLIECLYLYRDFTSEAVRILLPSGGGEASSDTTTPSFIAGLQLGLKLKYRGQVDHLRMLSYQEPEQNGGRPRNYLMIYDIVPGGTGYLAELLHDTQDLEKGGLMEVFRLARDHMAQCSCVHEPGKDGCYRCLYAYRNSYGMENTSRNTALNIFSDILNAADSIKPVESVGTIKTGGYSESELEDRFIEALFKIASSQVDTEHKIRVRRDIIGSKPGWSLKVGNNSYTIEPQPELGPNQGVTIFSRPDFLIRANRESDDFKPVAIFLDGFAYHRDSLAKDTAQRMAIVQSGKYFQWSLTWPDVDFWLSGKKWQKVNPFLEQRNASMKGLQKELRTRFKLDDLGQYSADNALKQLLHYLATPAPQQWQQAAFVSILGWFDQTQMQSEQSRSAFFDSLETMAPTGLQHLIEDLPKEAAFGGYNLISNDNDLRIACLVPHEVIRSFKPEKLGIALSLDTKHRDEDEIFRPLWMGFLHTMNLFQFLPLASFTTARGINSGQYEGIVWSYGEEGANGAQTTNRYGVELEAILLEALDELRTDIQALAKRNLPLPTIALELQDDGGEIIAQAELAWPDIKLAGLLPEQVIYKQRFTAKGWQTITLDNEGNWLDMLAKQAPERHG